MGCIDVTFSRKDINVLRTVRFIDNFDLLLLLASNSLTLTLVLKTKFEYKKGCQIFPIFGSSGMWRSMRIMQMNALVVPPFVLDKDQWTSSDDLVAVVAVLTMDSTFLVLVGLVSNYDDDSFT